MKEIEILIEVNDTKEKALKALEAFEYKGMKQTLDVYYHDPLRKDLEPDSEGKLMACFRIRSKGGKNYITYKNDIFIGDAWSHSDEYETEIGDFDTAVHIVEKLGLKELVRIDNEKHIYETPDYEIVLEDVKNLGLFLEVEKREAVDDDKVLQAKEEIRVFLTSLGIVFGKEQNAGKPELMLRKG